MAINEWILKDAYAIVYLHFYGAVVLTMYRERMTTISRWAIPFNWASKVWLVLHALEVFAIKFWWI